MEPGRFTFIRVNVLRPVEVVGHDPDTDQSLQSPICPVKNVTKDYPPTLLLHGDNDTDVPFEQSALMAKELARQGVQHEFIAMPGRGHGFDGAMSDPAIATTFDRVLTFLYKQLGR